MMQHRTISVLKPLVDRIEAIHLRLGYHSIAEYINEKLRIALPADELRTQSLKHDELLWREQPIQSERDDSL